MKLVVVLPSAAKSLDRLAEPVRSNIVEALSSYALGKAGDTKMMVGTPTVHMRVGDYRIFFDETSLHIDVFAIGHRREIYR